MCLIAARNEIISAYRIIRSPPHFPVSSMSFGREDPVLKSLHSQMKGFLTGKQEAMEVRIAQFEEDERRTFAQLQQKAHRERTLLFS